MVKANGHLIDPIGICNVVSGPYFSGEIASVLEGWCRVSGTKVECVFYAFVYLFVPLPGKW